ncbi:MAG: hypothetical protein V4538_14040 [Bacteroidota bacterium]
MANFAPQYDLFKISNKLSAIGLYVFWIILILSCIPLICNNFCVKHNLIDTLNILNIIGISLFFCTELINEFILIPEADNKRRDDFIDNSFGSKFSTNNSIGYYDNDEINKGLYKAAVNLFENCFFTYSLVKSKTISKIILPIIIFIVLILLAFYGFKQVPIALTILQGIFSANILGQVIKHFILFNKLSSIQDSWILLFQNNDLKSDTIKYQSHIYKYWLHYETLHSKINAGISDKFFIKHNLSLIEAWKKLKHKYNII